MLSSPQTLRQCAFDYFSANAFRIPLRRYAADNNLSLKEARHHFLAVGQFLAAAAMSDKPIAPSKEIDQPWHAFILATRQYESYCK